MDFDPTDEQTLLAETVHKLLDREYTAVVRRELVDSDLGWSRPLWSRFAALGLLGLGFDEEYGGSGQGVTELALVAENIGRHLTLEPFLSTVVLGAGLVRAAGSAQQKATILPAVASGDRLLAFAHAEPGARYSASDVSASAERTRDQWRVSGEKAAVLGADSADDLIVSARTHDQVALFVVAASDALRRPGRLHDGQRVADVLLASTPAVPLGPVVDATPAIVDVLDRATAVLCGETVGAMDRMLSLTVTHLKNRVQFGVPLASFQTLQHRAADMYVALEQARSMALLARACFGTADVVERHRIVRAAKVQVNLSSRLIGQDAIQLHGGIGLTTEYPLSHYVKRLEVNIRTLNDTSGLLAELGAEGGLVRDRSACA